MVAFIGLQGIWGLFSLKQVAEDKAVGVNLPSWVCGPSFGPYRVENLLFPPLGRFKVPAARFVHACRDVGVGSVARVRAGLESKGFQGICISGPTG